MLPNKDRKKLLDLLISSDKTVYHVASTLVTDRDVPVGYWQRASLEFADGSDYYRAVINTTGNITNLSVAVDWVADGTPTAWEIVDPFDTEFVDKAILRESYHFLRDLSDYLDKLNGYKY